MFHFTNKKNVCGIILLGILLLSIIVKVESLRGGLIRNGRSMAAFEERIGRNNPFQYLFLPRNRGYQEFMRFGRSSNNNNHFPESQQNYFRGRRDTKLEEHQNFFRNRRDDSDEAESARFG